MKTGEPHIDNNFNVENKGFPGVPSKELLRSIKSRMIIPIKIYGSVYGTLTLESQRKNFFNEDDVLISNAFSILAAIASFPATRRATFPFFFFGACINAG